MNKMCYTIKVEGEECMWWVIILVLKSENMRERERERFAFRIGYIYMRRKKKGLIKGLIGNRGLRQNHKLVCFFSSKKFVM